MPLLDKLQYLRLMGDGPATKVTPTAYEVDRVLAYAADVFSDLELKSRNLNAADVAAVYRRGDRTFCHVKAFPRKMPDTFVIAVTEDETILGHILIDLAAEYSEPYLDCPSFGFSGVPDATDIEQLIPGIRPTDDNPFAILSTSDGTYMQTLRTEDGYVLEHQLVNTSSHYETPEPASADEVVAAMVAYAFGENEDWLEAFAWRRQVLE